MSISEHFLYRNEVFQSDIFVFDIGITDVDVGCQISPTLRSMSMPTCGHKVESNKCQMGQNIQWRIMTDRNTVESNNCQMGQNVK
jgi:hypothetical protein